MSRARSPAVDCDEELSPDGKTDVSTAMAPILGLTEVPCGETHEKLRDPCSARSAEICRGAPVVNVFNADRERRPS